METKIEIQKSVIRAILTCAAKDDVRYYLNGVCLELGREESRLIATDGHRLAVYRLPEVRDCRLTETAQLIIPAAILRGIKKPGKRDSVTCVQIEVAGGTVTVRDLKAGTAQSAQLIDAKFPDWRAIVRNLKPSGEVAQYNPHYLADFADIGAELGVLGLTIGYNGNAPATVTNSDANFFGVVMPWRSDPAPKCAPDWIGAQLTPELRIAA